MSKKSKFKLKSWDHLKETAKSVNIKGEINYFLPMGYHGLSETQPIISAEDEILQDYQIFNENKWSQEGTIVLIGTNY